MMRIRLAVAVLGLASVSLAGCGSGGACVMESVQPGWEYCYDDWTEEDCSGGSFEAGEDCESLGFTKECPNDLGAKRRPSYSC